MQSPAISISGMNVLGGVPMFGAPDAGHPADSQGSGVPAYRIPPAAWGIALMVIGYGICRLILAD